MIKYRLDLRNFIGNVILKGGPEILHGYKQDGSDAVPVKITDRGLDWRTTARYLFSEKPFGVHGKVADDYTYLAEEI